MQLLPCELSANGYFHVCDNETMCTVCTKTCLDLYTYDGGRLEFSLRLQSSLTCGPLHMCPPSTHINTSGCKLSLKIHQKVIFYNTMVSFLCLLIGFVGQVIAVDIPENLEKEINLRASWGYLASNGPVQVHFVLLDIPDRFPALSGHMANQLWWSSRWILWWCKPVAHWPRLFSSSFGGPGGNHHGKHFVFG